MRNYRYVGHDKDSIHVHDEKDGKTFSVPRKHMSMKMLAHFMNEHAKQQHKLASGGYADGGELPATDPDSPNFRGPPEDWQELTPEGTNGGSTGPFGGMRQETNPSESQESFGKRVADFATRNVPKKEEQSEPSSGEPVKESTLQPTQPQGEPMGPPNLPGAIASGEEGSSLSGPPRSAMNEPQRPQSLDDMYREYGDNMQKAAQVQQNANITKANADAAYSNRQAQIMGAANQMQLQQQQHFQKARTDIENENNTLHQAMANSKIDPNNYFDSKSTVGKIGTLVGFIISGAGANAGQGNAAINAYNKAVNDDVDAQKSNLGIKKSLLQSNLERYRDLSTAEQQTRLDMAALTKGMIDQAAAQQGGPIAQATAADLNAKLDAQMAPIKLDVASKRAGAAMFQQGSAAPSTPSNRGGYDTSRAMGLKQLGYINDKQYNDIISESGEYKGLQDQLAVVNDSFNSMSQTGTSKERYSHVLPEDIQRHLPTWDESSKQFEASRATLSAAVSKILGARTNPAIMGEVERSLPVQGDSPQTLELKKQQLDNIIKMNTDKGKQFPFGYHMGLINPNDPNLSIRRTGPMQQGPK